MDLYEEIERQRLQTRQADEARDADVDKQPAGIKQFCDMSYGEDDMQVFDCYAPDDDALHPVIINVHGGGWYYGDKEIYKAYCLRLAKQGYCVVNFSYRLAPEHPYPAALNDVNRLFHYIASSLHRYDGDVNRVNVVADSAGAQLALQYVTLQMNDDFRHYFDYEKLPYDIQKAALYCGVYFLETSPTMTEGRLKQLRHAYLPNNIWAKYREQLKPEAFMMDTKTDWLLATGKDDFLCEDTLRLHQFLDEKARRHTFYDYRSDTESVRHVFELHPHTHVAEAALNDLIQFLSE